MGQTPFRLVYGKEAVIPTEYPVPSLRIFAITNMVGKNIMDEQLEQLITLEEDRFVASFHQQVHKAREKSWHDQHMKQHTFKNGDLVLLYDSNFMKFPGKFKMHWLGTYIVKNISNCGAVQLAKLHEEKLPRRVNGIQLKIYREDFVPKIAQ